VKPAPQARQIYFSTARFCSVRLLLTSFPHLSMRDLSISPPLPEFAHAPNERGKN
jgi:hypothetical protein